MQMNNHYPVANLPADLLQKIQTLEEEIRSKANENIILVAYESEN